MKKSNEKEKEKSNEKEKEKEKKKEKERMKKKKKRKKKKRKKRDTKNVLKKLFKSKQIQTKSYRIRFVALLVKKFDFHRRQIEYRQLQFRHY